MSPPPGEARGPVIAAALLVTMLTAAGFFGIRLAAWGRTLVGLRLAGEDVGGVERARLPERIQAIAQRYLDESVALGFGEQTLRLRRVDLGLRVDVGLAAERAYAAGRSGDPIADLRDWWRARAGRLDLVLPTDVDQGRTIETLNELKETLDRAPVNAHLDLDGHALAPERPGILLQAYESLAVVEQAARRGADSLALRTVSLPAGVTRADLPQVDLAVVLGSWETRFSSVGPDSDRSFNLKVGAERLNGHVLKPHEVFSFNDVVGPRTEMQGYRVAPVIQAGELIDGLAGGMCQIASTLHVAAFFAGLDIVSATPHSRPSSYVPLGLDATVVYPSTDLKLRNPFDFPIVIHYQVNQGRVKVELLGKERPYRVLFEREILQERHFGSDRRRDPTAPNGQRYLLQAGYPGYRIVRRRFLFSTHEQLPRRWGSAHEPATRALERAGRVPLKSEKWSLHYPATEEIWAVGTGPRRLKPKPKPPSHRIPPVPRGEKPIARILR